MEFTSVRGGVRIATDDGLILGIAPPGLSSDDALAALGYELDDDGALHRAPGPVVDPPPPPPPSD